jgi:hypothetical protein
MQETALNPPQAITACKVRDRGRQLAGTARSDFTAVLFRAPTVGECMLVVRLPAGDTLKTSTVRDVSVDAKGTIWVETMNSTYRLVPGAPWAGFSQAA